MFGTSSLPLIKFTPISASIAEDITTSIIFEMTKIRALGVGFLSVSQIKKLDLSDRK